MDVALKIWRFDPARASACFASTRSRRPSGPALLDVLDLDQGPARRLARVPQELPDDDLRLLRDAHGRRARCSPARSGCTPIVDAGHVPVDLGDGEPAVVKDLVVDMDPFWAKFRAMKPWLAAGLRGAAGRQGAPRLARSRWTPIQKEALCIMCGCCVSECNSMESDPEFLGPAALAKGFRFVGDPRDQAEVERLERYNDEHGIWDCTRCYFCNERCPKGVDPRDAIAKLGAESIKAGIDRDMGAKHAKWFVTLGQDDRLAARDGARAEDAGHHRRAQGDEVRAQALEARQGAAPFPPHVAEGRPGGACALRPREGAGPRAAPRASSRASTRSRARARLEGERPVRRGSFPEHARGGGSAMKRSPTTRAASPRSRRRSSTSRRRRSRRARARARGARIGHLLRRRRHPRGRARLLPPPERAHPRLRRGDRLRHADDDLQRLHAQPAAGELQLQNDDALRARVNENLESVGVAALRRRRRGEAPALADRRGRRLRAAEGRSRTRASRG